MIMQRLQTPMEWSLLDRVSTGKPRLATDSGSWPSSIWINSSSVILNLSGILDGRVPACWRKGKEKERAAQNIYIRTHTRAREDLHGIRNSLSGQNTPWWSVSESKATMYFFLIKESVMKTIFCIQYTASEFSIRSPNFLYQTYELLCSTTLWAQPSIIIGERHHRKCL